MFTRAALEVATASTGTLTGNSILASLAPNLSQAGNRAYLPAFGPSCHLPNYNTTHLMNAVFRLLAGAQLFGLLHRCVGHGWQGGMPGCYSNAFCGPGNWLSSIRNLGQSMRWLMSASQSSVRRFWPRDVSASENSVDRVADRFDAAMKAGDFKTAKEIADRELNLEWTDFSSYPGEAKTAQKFLNQLKKAHVKLDQIGPGESLPRGKTPGKVNFTAAEAQRINSALSMGGDQAAERVVLDILSSKYGEPFTDDPDALKKEYSSRKWNYDAKTQYDNADLDWSDPNILTSNTRLANKIFGTKVPHHESGYYTTTDKDGKKLQKIAHGNKLKSSTYALKAFAGNVVDAFKQSRGVDIHHHAQVHQALGGFAPFGLFSATSIHESFCAMPTTGAFSVDGSSYIAALKEIASYSTPLIFDIHGVGLKVKDSKLIAFDIDVDGEDEFVSDVGSHGLVVFDSKAPGREEGKISGKDVFGSHTDLSAYGLMNDDDQESVYDNGFASFRAVAEYFGLIDDDKSYLDSDDLKVLEDQIGLRLRVGGIIDGEDQRLTELGITRVNLGRPEDVQALTDAELDMWHNRIMRQEGATFLMNGEEREYADLWFNILARRPDKQEAPENHKAQEVAKVKAQISQAKQRMSLSPMVRPRAPASAGRTVSSKGRTEVPSTRRSGPPPHPGLIDRRFSRRK